MDGTLGLGQVYGTLGLGQVKWYPMARASDMVS